MLHSDEGALTLRDLIKSITHELSIVIWNLFKIYPKFIQNLYMTLVAVILNKFHNQKFVCDFWAGEVPGVFTEVQNHIFYQNFKRKHFKGNCSI